MKTKDTKVKDTYNMIKPPILEEANNTIIFGFSKYVIEDDKLRSGFYRDLCAAIKKLDYPKIYDIVCKMDEYRTGAVVAPRNKQTEIVAVTAKKRKVKEKTNDKDNSTNNR